MRKKVTVVGGGFVGSTTAQRIVDMELADVVLTDILDGPPAGKGLDMLESTPITGSDARVTGISTASGDYKETANSDVVVITAGFPRKPGMSRDDLLKANYEVIKTVVEQVAKYSPNAILIMVTNPLDAMVQVAYKVSGFSKNRVMGMAGVLDSARMSTFVATELGVSVENVHSFVLGGHGDDMGRQRHHVVAMSSEDERMHDFYPHTQLRRHERAHSRGIQHSGHSHHAVFREAAHLVRHLHHGIQRIRDHDEDRIR